MVAKHFIVSLYSLSHYTVAIMKIHHEYIHLTYFRPHISTSALCMSALHCMGEHETHKIAKMHPQLLYNIKLMF